MRIDAKDKHFNSIFTVLDDRIEIRGSGGSLTLKDNEVRSGGSTLYKIMEDRLEDRIDGQTYWLKSHASSGDLPPIKGPT